jgi:ketosteroid isomerase-like protein
MTTHAQQLERLARQHQDRIEIMELKHAFCRGADVLDIEAMMVGFADDVVASYLVGEEIQGKDELRGWLHQEVDITIASSHMVTNFEIVFESDDVAHSRCQLNSWKRFVGHPERQDRLRWATYTERWTRVDGSWRQSGLVYRVAGEINGGTPERAVESSPTWPPSAGAVG